MTFVHVKPHAGFVKRTQTITLKIHHTTLNSCKGARLYDCAAVATCNSDACILSSVNQ